MSTPNVSRRHLARLRQIHRSSGWPCHDAVEVELLVLDLVSTERDHAGRETLRLTPIGLQALADSYAQNRAGLDAHNTLVRKTAHHLQQHGRIVWTELPLRAHVNGSWTKAIPDVFSVRNTTVENYLQPIVHEIKVSRGDLLCDLRKEEKRAAYLAIASQVYYVLGNTLKGKCIGTPQEIPQEFGVILETPSGIELVRVAPPRSIGAMRFDIWMTLAKASPLSSGFESDQMHL